MKKLLTLITILGLAISSSYADGKQIAKQLGLDPSSKAIRQWERVFKKEHKMKKLGIDKLSQSQKDELKEYLIAHAADSDHPEAAGM